MEEIVQSEFVDIETANNLKLLGFNDKTAAVYLLEDYKWHFKKDELIFKSDAISSSYTNKQSLFELDWDDDFQFIYAPTWQSAKWWLYKNHGIKFHESYLTFSSSLEHEIKIDGYDCGQYFIVNIIIQNHDIYSAETKAIQESVKYLLNRKS